jgi:hypothetical protein
VSQSYFDYLHAKYLASSKSMAWGWRMDRAGALSNKLLKIAQLAEK